ncbi:MAG: peptidase M48 [Ignavibacteria bacterium]|nr:peptidase M48 [Ignavibacteria bacterium]
MKKIIFFSLIITSLSFLSCSESGINLFSDQDEVNLGAQVDAEIRSNPAEFPIYTADPYVKNYINSNIFIPILNSPEVKKRGVYNYNLEIIKNDTTLNAFATPGGYVYLYTGILKYLDSEAALAGVLGHEIAHAERRHATQRITAYYGVSILLGLILGDNPTQLAELVANLFTGLAFLANSRANEDDSDDYSIRYLKSTKYYPGGVKFFFEKMRDDGLVSSGNSQILTFLSTHPDPVERIKSADDRLTSQGLKVIPWTSNDADVFRGSYTTNIKNRLR